MNAHMRGEYLVEISSIAALRDDCAYGHILCQGREHSSCICESLLPRAFDPIPGGSAWHPLGHMEAESFGVIEDFDHFVADDLRLRQRPAYHDARCPASVDADSNRGMHVRINPKVYLFPG